MNVVTGDLYETREAAIAAGVPEDSAVEVRGPLPAILRLRQTIAAERGRQTTRQGWDRYAQAHERRPHGQQR